jgi:death-on-curing protein
MEEIGPEIAYPTIEQIIDANRRLIKESGGSFTRPTNLRNRQSLEYILDAIAFPLFGTELYPSIKEKAAALAHRIITAHVFMDGNKRTGIHAAWEFLRANGISLNLDASVEDLAVDLALRRAGYDDLLKWLHSHQ